MRDVHSIAGKKVYVEDLEDAIERVRALYPTATRQGSVGAWSWAVGDYIDPENIVAEAWLHATRPGWWLRIKK